MISIESDLGRCYWALHHAIGRWQQSVSVEEPSRSLQQYAAIGETLFWAAALDDVCRGDEHSPEQIAGYSRDRGTQTQLLEGLHYARNRVTHGIAQPTKRRDGLTFPMSFPITFGTHWVWRPASEIPPPVAGRGRGDAAGRQRAYENHWQGKRVNDTINELRDWFAAAMPQTEQ